MEWTVYNFECADEGARQSLLSWFEEENPVEIPEDEDSVHGALTDADGEEIRADVAWIAEYVYVLTNPRVAGLLAASADRWERAVVAEFDSTTETCTEATLYRSEDGEPVEEVRYEGVEELGGQGMVYRFAMDHQFRFRAFAHAPPTPMITKHFGAFDAVVGLAWGSDRMDFFERETGVAPTARGLEFLEDDPVLEAGEFYEAVESE
ncbi:hypothetical protein [Halomicrobium salinisoli]|uniref:hypothetical protein n=1 Tax=Halomicrobium salinisoli TaxID=2878391 RepID=UPI001CF09240|nr:hypothetical protein [Halomicrobium salinisoli]